MEKDEFYVYYVDLVMADPKGRIINLHLPTERLPDNLKGLSLITLERSNFGLQYSGYEKIEIPKLNSILQHLNTVPEVYADTIMALFMSSSNHSYDDLVDAYYNYKYYERLPIVNSKSELTAGELFMSGIITELDFRQWMEFSDKTKLGFFYLGLRSRGIIVFEGYYWVHTCMYEMHPQRCDLEYITDFLGQMERS